MPALPEYDHQRTWREQDFQVSARLHVQHLLWDFHLNYVTHPSIPLDEEHVTIADVACGNGAWLLDAARRHPHATLVGFDLTLNNAPAPPWAPKNCTFHTWDMFSEVPDAFVGAFDVVHVRALFSLVINNQADHLVDNLLKLLKPGGCLQWDEADLPTFRAESSPSGAAPATTTLATIFSLQMLRAQRLLGVWLHALPATLRDKGCDVLAHDRILPRPECQRMWCDNFFTLFLGIATKLPEGEIQLPEIEGAPRTFSRDSYLRLIEEAAAECAAGLGWVHYEAVVVVARKIG